MLSRPNSVLSESAYTNDVIDLMYKLMEYRNQEIRHRLEKVGRAASMLHLDGVLLIYHFAKVASGNILEIGPYVGGSTIAAALGARESGKAKKIISVEPGGRLDHFKIPSKNIFKDLKKNLARFGVLEDITLINGRSFDETTKLAVRQSFRVAEVGLFIFDADDNVRRDLDCYGDLLADRCWLVIDDYFGPCVKAAPIQAQVDDSSLRDDCFHLDITGGHLDRAVASLLIYADRHDCRHLDHSVKIFDPATSCLCGSAGCR